jgi:hypothetical protein
MKFFQGDSSVEISEAFSDKSLKLYVRHNRGDNYGVIDFDECRLVEMRNWINRQILKIKKAKNVKPQK